MRDRQGDATLEWDAPDTATPGSDGPVAAADVHDAAPVASSTATEPANVAARNDKTDTFAIPPPANGRPDPDSSATGLRRAPLPRVEVIAHRGASADAPENTLSSIRRAHQIGADWCEVDCAMTADGHIVLLHDDSVARTTDGEGLVTELSLAHLKTLDAGSWKSAEFHGERIPTLEEALRESHHLATTTGRRIGLFLEIKASDDRDRELAHDLLRMCEGVDTLGMDLADRMLAAIDAVGTETAQTTRTVIDCVRRHGMEDHVVIQSFSPVACAVAAIEAPEIRVDQLVWCLGAFKRQPEHAARWVTLLGLNGLNPNAGGVTDEELASLHAAGRTMSVWTVNDRMTIRALAKLGVDRIITDKPALAITELRRLRKRTVPFNKR